MSQNQQQSNPWGNTQQHNVFPQGQANFAQNDFPSMGTQAQQQQTAPTDDNPFATGSSGDFNPTAVNSSSFVPAGVNALTEEDLTFGEAFGGGGKKKASKKESNQEKKLREQEEANALLPTKGKPISFFQY